MKLKFCLISLVLFITLLLNAEAELPKLVIGGDYNYPPYEYLNKAGQADGYNVELSRIIAAELGYEPVFRLGKWSLVRAWLDTGEVDVLQGMAYSAERAREIHFSLAHTSTWRSIFIPKNSKLKDIEAQENISVVIQKDDVAMEYLDQIDFTGKISTVASQEEALALLNDEIFDAAVTNYMMSRYIIKHKNLKNIRSLSQRINPRDYCYASPDAELIEKINLALEKMQRNGVLKRLQEKWFDELDLREARSEGFFDSYWNNVIHVFMLLVFAILVVLFAIRLNRQKEAYKKLLASYQEQHRSFENYQKLFADGPVMVYVIDYQKMKLLKVTQNIKQYNANAEDYLVSLDTLLSIVYSDDKERVKQDIEQLTVNQPNISQYRTIMRNGKIRWVINYQILLHEEAEDRSYLYGYIIDITDLKNMEEQLMDAKDKAEAASIAKDHFLADMSHEIRTPLSGINGFLQILMQNPATDEQKEIFDYMFAAGKNLIKTVNDILDFSKIESGKMELVFSDFNVKYLIEDMVRQFDYQVHNDQLTIRSNLSKSLPNVVHGDQLRLKQILLNLMHNAIKFTPQGSIELGAEIYTNSESELRILFRVADTGIGIEDQRLKDIFENYVQAEASIMHKYGGTGLGLAIVKRLVEIMKGFIWVESETNRGTSFFFILPFLHPKQQPQEQEFDELPKLEGFKTLKGHVLLVEDDEINQMVCQRLLEMWGLQVEICEDGEEAVRLHKNKLFDLIVMDIRLPVMDGVSATLAIREMEKVLYRHTPIVAITAAALEGDKERFLASGLDDYLAKPIDIKQMHETLAKYLDEK